MRNAKKFLAILLTFALCFSLCAVMSSAESTFNPKVKLSASYNGSESDEVFVVVTTSQACGAISGTLTYTGATYVEAKANEEGTDQFVQTDGQVKFVIVTDKLTADGGDFAWAAIKFNNITADASFELNNVKVCDVGASNLNSPAALTIEDVKPITVVGTLGSQYRDANPDQDITSGLRFGAKIVRGENNSLTNLANKTAVSCGCLMVAAENNLSGANLSSYVAGVNADYTLNLKDEKPNKLLSIKSQYYKDSTDSYLVYTFVVKNISENNADKDIIFLPYVVYKDGNELKVEYGTQISRNFNEVKNAFDFVSKQPQ